MPTENGANEANFEGIERKKGNDSNIFQRGPNQGGIIYIESMF